DPHQACQIWGPAFGCTWVQTPSQCVPRTGAGVVRPANGCTNEQLCAFYGRYANGCSATQAICQLGQAPGHCDGTNSLCKSAQSSPTPQQTCQIWAALGCVWTPPAISCIPHGMDHPDACSMNQYCGALNYDLRVCAAIPACAATDGNAHC